MKFNSKTEFIGHYSEKEILNVLRENLRNCDSFRFSVSFVMESGLRLLLPDIKKALQRGCKGCITTTDYMRITTSGVLTSLLELMNVYSNFKCYFLETKKTEYDSFHTKGYIFTKDNVASIIIGSSNMSATALSKDGGEWSLFSTTYSNEKLFKEVNEEYEKNLKEIGKPLSLEQINNYSQLSLNLSYGKAEPNFMQIAALKALNEVRVKENKKRALIVAAMGSGKTYLSAFDAKNMGGNHILYICHNEEILKSAYSQYQKVFEDSKTYGFFIGNKKDSNSDIIFATNSSLVRHLSDFSKTYFDYIIFDEAHHITANTYQTILKYFSPNFILGMTGTPDRTDQVNVKEIFGNSVPYELSLRDAIKFDVIMPFKYYGVKDGLVNYSKKNSEESLLEEMISKEHGIFIKEQIELHLDEIQGKLKCLGFCSTVEQAKKMSVLMNSLGYKTDFVYGDTNSDVRKVIYNRLQNENDELQIVFSVNVMNEGVDLPNVNMTLFLRPTESSIVFIQQLGRSLRKAENKNKPVIIDFVGNKYERSIYIAWALGELVDAPVLTKPILKTILSENNSSLKELGVNVSFDSESKKEINDYLNSLNFNSLEILKKSYEDHKKYCSIATCPSQTSFIAQSSGFDLMRIISVHGSYYRFLHRINEQNVPFFSTPEVDFIDYLSDLLPLSRPYEYRIIQTLIENGSLKSNVLKELVANKIGSGFVEKRYLHALDYLQLKTESENKKENSPKYLLLDNESFKLGISIEDKKIYYHDNYAELDFNNEEFRQFVLDLLNFGLVKYEQNQNINENGFTLFSSYSRKEFTRVICFKSVYSFQPGVQYAEDDKLVGIFVDLVKKKDVEEHLNYGDKFISKTEFEWESQTGTVIGNKRYKRLIECNDVEIFVRKFQHEDGVNLPYVYLGKGRFTKPRNTKNVKQTVKFNIVLDNQLSDELFEEFNIDLEN